MFHLPPFSSQYKHPTYLSPFIQTPIMLKQNRYQTNTSNIIIFHARPNPELIFFHHAYGLFGANDAYQ